MTMNRRQQRPPKKADKPFTESCANLLQEITIGLVSMNLDGPPSEQEIREALIRSFGTVQKGYGTCVALRNTLRGIGTRKSKMGKTETQAPPVQQ